MSKVIDAVVARAMRGDRQAFFRIYQEHIGRVYAICWRLLGDRQRAEDAAQEIFIKVWEHLPRFKGDSSFMTWLRSIATRTAIDHWRREQRLQFVDSGVEETEIGSIPAMDAENHDLEQAIQRLPSQARAVFILFALEGYQHSEIAELLGIAEGSSKAQYHRARTLLRGFLGEQ
ncbi:RNA polymerase sigma factor [Pseudohongiella spirulinae]|uniref:RNA polymerase sigma-70 factor, ECF subfamily n=1 Tax=Pseudohongiella spirulinae TaxID=1249552 RepID=A0A0S2K9F6_9GAMM|nr:RNA polymerase sigma factor [Pseudohongiella spirulinae]ALO44977.1 RNA polymerase sigma-70 factor, ECF subfamily [Pseudohongiella spirulinae]